MKENDKKKRSKKKNDSGENGSPVDLKIRVKKDSVQKGMDDEKNGTRKECQPENLLHLTPASSLWTLFRRFGISSFCGHLLRHSPHSTQKEAADF